MALQLYPWQKAEVEQNPTVSLQGEARLEKGLQKIQ